MELAADYLVMAAWLAYLKSRLLLPRQHDERRMPAEELAARLAFRLQRLQAMREAAAQLMARNLLGRDVFGRGAPEPLVVTHPGDLCRQPDRPAEGLCRTPPGRATARNYTIKPLPTWSIKEARAVLERLIGTMDDWGRLDEWSGRLPDRAANAAARSCARLSAGLELAREGHLELRQDGAFQPHLHAPPVAATGQRRLERAESHGQDIEPGAFGRSRQAMSRPGRWRGQASRARRAQALRVVEAVLFAAAEPVAADNLATVLPEGTDVVAVLEELRRIYAAAASTWCRWPGDWAFRTAGDLSFLLRREAVEQRRLSRAALETLAIIAYHQPVTRADIEEIRGVAISKGTLDTLMEIGWVKLRGRRRTPGPARHLRHHAEAFWSISASTRPAICPASTN